MALSLKAQDILWDIKQKSRTEMDKRRISYYGGTCEELYEVLKEIVYPIALHEVETSGVKLCYAKGDDDWKATCITINIAIELRSEVEMRAIADFFKNRKNQGE